MRRPFERGATIAEFVLAVSLIFVPLLLGTMVVGVNLSRSIQITQLNRDAGHMFARGVDFAQTANRDLLTMLAGSLDLTSAGKSVVIFSQMLKVDCTSCANRNRLVFTRRIVVGNSTLRTSAYGTPSGVGSDGNVSNYLNSSGARVTGFDPAMMTVSLGETVYVVEGYYRSSELDLPGFMTGTGVSAKGVF
jgi:hypothetical protein